MSKRLVEAVKEFRGDLGELFVHEGIRGHDVWPMGTRPTHTTVAERLAEFDSVLANEELCETIEQEQLVALKRLGAPSTGLLACSLGAVRVTEAARAFVELVPGIAEAYGISSTSAEGFAFGEAYERLRLCLAELPSLDELDERLRYLPGDFEVLTRCIAEGLAVFYDDGEWEVRNGGSGLHTWSEAAPTLREAYESYKETERS